MLEITAPISRNNADEVFYQRAVDLTPLVGGTKQLNYGGFPMMD